VPFSVFRGPLSVAVSPLCVGFLLASVLGAHAVPPLVTDDAEVADHEVFEIYTGFDYQGGGGSVSRELPTTELDYGILDRTEFSLVIPYLSQSGQAGFGDLDPGVKYIVIEETKTWPAIAASFDCKLTNGSVGRGLGSGNFNYDFLVPVQKSWGWFTAMADIGFNLVGNTHFQGVTERRYNLWFAGFAERYKINEKTTLLSEVYAQRADAPGQPNLCAFDVGFEREIGHGVALQGAIGRSLRESNHDGPTLQIYVGLHWTFDAPWKREKKDEK